MRKLAIIDKNPQAHLTQWKAAPDPKKFFHRDGTLVTDINSYNPDIIFINKGNTFTNCSRTAIQNGGLLFCWL